MATIESQFYGAYSGEETATFAWREGSWQRTGSTSAIRNGIGAERVNLSITAAASFSTLAIEGVYARQWQPSFDRIDDPQYLPDQAEVIKDDKVTRVGPGTVTSVRSKNPVGFIGGQNPWGSTCAKPRYASVTQWTNGASTTLGSGVAYDSNASGDIVGDDETYFGGNGHPTLWSHRRPIELSSGVGAAYAISDQGLIVGKVANGAFVQYAASADRSVRLLDKYIVDHRWHIIAAYGVSTNGTILGFAKRAHGDPQLVLLIPRPAISR